MNHRDHLEWDLAGRCKYRVLKHRPCGDRHFESYTDEYGTWQHCPDCRGNGKISYTVWVPVPEFDAPKPTDGWVPDWVET